MGLLSSMIVTVCMGAQQDSYRSACNSALDAGTQYYGFDEDVERIEQNGTRMANRFAYERLGERGKSVTGGAIYVIRAAANRTLVVPIPTWGYADRVESQFKPDSMMISFSWSW